ncbi:MULTISPECIES: hypothetical protein [Xanthomonas]|uniref:DUF1707 domain-containing protein n=1 Tax=Xanthomonas cucurbitae TaxID=56453 RepID=A0A2S7DNW7_9XANT|nr:hypothetical protein [Xanthomonas cucurbitae]PPU75467.1 hypothetical protein XcuCFBP2542_14270 [Xanthomonas cucurbitae]QHG85799.1 hypothetical protein EBN15_01175 [Xanthomonas cucurbitae]WDM67450.1 hypothetical protein K6981_18625 [Xanthomonas cucurbitae]WDM71326.1 hypothetical protein K6978_18590 [Xanthomonas cucurbitae]WDM75694.1 hypothetical protein K6982_01165 [Xanthomonas cucurbitae]
MSHDGTTQHAANAQLQALAQAHQHGQLDRAQYRARRRSVLEAARQAQGATLRNPPLRPADPYARPPRQANRFSQRRRRNVAIVVTVTVVALILLIFREGALGFDRRSVRSECPPAEHHPGLETAACAADAVGHARQRMFSGVSDECV